MDDAGRLGRLGTLRDRPGARLLGPCREVGLQAKGVEADTGELVEAALGLAGGGEELRRIRRFEVDQFRLELGVEEDRLRRGDEGGERGERGGIPEDLLVDVKHIDKRLRGQQPEFANRLGVEARRRERLTVVQKLLCGERGLQHDRLGALRLDFLLEADDRLLEGLQVGENELGIDGLHVGGRVDFAVDVHDIRIGESTDDLRDRVRLADVGEKLVAEPLADGRALDDSRDVDEGDRSGEDALAAKQLRQPVEPGIRKADDTDVGLDRGERVVRGEHLVFGEGVEEGGLADIGQSDDCNSESHGGQF